MKEVLQFQLEDLRSDAIRLYDKTAEILLQTEESSGSEAYDVLLGAVVVHMLTKAYKAKAESLWNIANEMSAQLFPGK